MTAGPKPEFLQGGGDPSSEPIVTQDYSEAMTPPENCEVWASFNNVLSISTDRLVHRDQRFLNHDGNRNAAHL
uniref:Uncharacterized protein n=1 Tax=Magallana gigas TaxID=29159 RepID=A0A8W8MQ69_MAGGI